MNDSGTYYELQTQWKNLLWKHLNSPQQREVKAVISVKKVMLIFFLLLSGAITQRCQQLQNFLSSSGADIQILKLQKWNKN